MGNWQLVFVFTPVDGPRGRVYFDLRNERKPGWFGFTRDDKLSSYMGMIS